MLSNLLEDSCSNPDVRQPTDMERTWRSQRMNWQEELRRDGSRGGGGALRKARWQMPWYWCTVGGVTFVQAKRLMNLVWMVLRVQEIGVRV